MSTDYEGAMKVFEDAWKFANSSEFAGEVEWQQNRRMDCFTETDLLREVAWVILCSGFNERVVRRWFDYLSLCFSDWESACAIVETIPECKLAAIKAFNNERKIDAIIASAVVIEERGFSRIKKSVLADPLSELRTFPYIGPVTVWHLAKNLGLGVAKADRHLKRLSNQLGFENVEKCCDYIASQSGNKIQVVDLVLWRYLASGRKMTGIGKL